MNLDRTDALLLAEIQRNNRTPIDVLGQALGLSAAAVRRRMKRLRTNGIIEAEVAILSPRAVGHNVTMVILVGLERERSEIIDHFKSKIRATPNVLSGYYVTGDADFALVVTAEDMEQYEAFTRSFFDGNPDVKWVKTMVCMDRVKATFALPLDTARFK